MSKRTEFLKATRKGGWKTMEDLVADLDRASYWEGRWSPAGKRAHARRMIATLILREAAPRGATEGTTSTQRHVFVSVIKATDSGKLARVYKQAFDLTPGELGDALEAEETRWALHARRAALVDALADPDAEAATLLLLDELSETTLQRAWPGAGPAERRRIAAAAAIKHRRSEEALREISERCHAEGLDVEELLDGYLRATGAPPVVDPKEANEIAKPAAEYFKVAGDLEGFDLAKTCLTALAAAREDTLRELAEREALSLDEARTFLAGTPGERVDELQGALEAYLRDAFGWALDEHLQFTVEQRSEP